MTLVLPVLSLHDALPIFCALPVLPAAGVTVTVRFAPLPPNTIFAFGTSVVDDDEPETVRLEAAVSASPTVDHTSQPPSPFDPLCPAMAVIVGGVLVPVT